MVELRITFGMLSALIIFFGITFILNFDKLGE